MLDKVTADFERRLNRAIQLEPRGPNTYDVVTPFQFDDGDHLVIVLSRLGHQWWLSDEGHTFMQLTYELDEGDLRSGTRLKLINNALRTFGVRESQGELTMQIPDDEFGDSLFNFIQAILKINDVRYITRERVRSTFFEDLGALVTRVVPERRRASDWYDIKRDPQAKYKVHWRINERPRPLFLYGLSSDQAVRDANIALLQFEKWQVPHLSVAVFEDQQEIGRDVLARFTDVVNRQFSSLDAQDRIEEYLTEQLAVDAR